MGFKDHFSKQAVDYARYRPRYPSELFERLAQLAPGRELAWDCATGSGQAALGLAPHFECIVATDASAEQIAHAIAGDNIEYRVAPAERSEIASSSIDLIVVAQALHWFDFEKFHAEVRRVLKSRGILAASCYNLFRIDPEIDAIHDRYYRDVVGPYWPPERMWIDEGYRTIPFPLSEIKMPDFRLSVSWDLADVLGYLGTWSSTRRFIDDRGVDPLASIEADLESAWGDPATRRRVEWPLIVRVGRLA